MRIYNFTANELKQARDRDYIFYDYYTGYFFVRDGEHDSSYDDEMIERIKLKNFTPKQLAAVWYDKKNEQHEIDCDDSTRWDVLAALTGCDGDYYQRRYNGSVEVADIIESEIGSDSLFNEDSAKVVFEAVDAEIAAEAPGK